MSLGNGGLTPVSRLRRLTFRAQRIDFLQKGGYHDRINIPESWSGVNPYAETGKMMTYADKNGVGGVVIMRQPVAATARKCTNDDIPPPPIRHFAWDSTTAW